MALSTVPTGPACARPWDKLTNLHHLTEHSPAVSVRYHYPWFTEEETRTQRREQACSRLQRQELLGLLHSLLLETSYL